MSIYSSIDGDDPITYDAGYHPEPLTEDSEPCGVGFVDVAIAYAFHNKIRVIVAPSNLCLDATGARELARRLLIAANLVDYIKPDGTDREASA